MKLGDYYNAAQYYKEGLDKYEFNIELKYKYAEALRGFNDYSTAAEVYKKLIEEDVTHQYPLSVFWYGLMLHSLGKYEPAIAQFRKFLNKYSAKDYYHDKAQQELESCSWARDNEKDTVKVKIVHLPEGINTSFSEFNPFENKKQQLMFSSLRDQRKKNGSAKILSRIYISDSSFKEVRIYSLPANENKHIANGAFSPDWQRFYFTLCEPYEQNGALLHCNIYMSRLMNDSPSTCLPLGGNINLPDYTSTQPNIGIDEHGQELLFFVSDRPGGMGKTDIWVSRILSDTTFADPVNLGKEVNSPDEEFSPFYDNREHKLYFASNWHYGFGGLDIFGSKKENGTWTGPENLGRSVNSPQNDFYFFESADRSKNYFTSNRKGSLYLKSETCCNDIWMYETGIKPEKEMVERPQDTLPVVINLKDTIAPSPGSMVLSVPKDTPQRIWIDKTLSNIKQLLPLTLYFHNDEPECCNLRDTTGLNYVETYNDYWHLLEKYKSEFSNGLSGPQKNAAEQQVFELFTNKVEKGYHQLIQFSAQLLDLLETGSKIELTIQGYCSPLHANSYNIMLGYRRIASLRNYFFHYRDGILLPYISAGRLNLKNESLGEEKAAAGVSDNREDTRNSVYNPKAALERKVEIISVELK